MPERPSPAAMAGIGSHGHQPIYDRIGTGYAARRRPDPRIAAQLVCALGGARSVLNVGAGAGSYEPADRLVVAVEPSREMAAQRPATAPPAVLARAEALPFLDGSFAAVMALLTVHHWSDVREGIAEALRVARDRVVVLTVDPTVEAAMWLFSEYVPEIATSDATSFPPVAELAAWLGPTSRVEVVPVPSDCTDGFLLSFWSSPERVLDSDARAATSGFALLDTDVEARAVDRLARDLRSGAWDERHGHLRGLEAFDAGLRLVIADRLGSGGSG